MALRSLEDPTLLQLSNGVFTIVVLLALAGGWGFFKTRVRTPQTVQRLWIHGLKEGDENPLRRRRSASSWCSPRISACSHALARRQSRITVSAGTFTRTAVGLLHAQPAKEPQLDHAALALVELREWLQRVDRRRLSTMLKE